MKLIIDIPDNATNKDVMRAMFPDGVKTSIAYPRDVSKEWLNAPYQKGGNKREYEREYRNHSEMILKTHTET